MFLISVFICFCIAAIINYFTTRKQRSFITNLKGPFAFPLVGSLHKLVLLNPKNFTKKSARYFEEFGKFSRCWIFHHLLILTADYELVEQLLNSKEHQNTGYNLLKPWLGKGLLTCPDETWFRRRQSITHAAFEGSALDEFVEIFEGHSKKLVESLREVSDGTQTFDVSKYFSKTVLDIMIEATLGIKGQSQPKFAKLIKTTTEHFTQRYLNLSSVNNATYTVMSPRHKRRQTRLIKSINKTNKDIINERRQRSLETKVESPLNNTVYTIEVGANLEPAFQIAEHINFLDLLLGAHIDNVALTDVEICDELNTFLFHGYLLTTSALCSMFVMLARHPAVLGQVRQEIEQVWPDSKQEKIYCSSNLNRLSYLDCVIKETLRLYPAFPIIARDLKEPFQYTHSKVGDGILPIGSEIYINVYEMLRDEEAFAEPKRFRPERFLEQQESSNKLLQFGMGPRNCVGQRLTVLLLKTVLVHILDGFELLPFGNELRVEFKIGLTSHNGFQIGLEAR